MRQEIINIIPSQATASINSDAVPAQNLLYASAQIVAVGGGSAGTAGTAGFAGGAGAAGYIEVTEYYQ